MHINGPTQIHTLPFIISGFQTRTTLSSKIIDTSLRVKYPRTMAWIFFAATSLLLPRSLRSSWPLGAGDGSLKYLSSGDVTWNNKLFSPCNAECIHTYSNIGWHRHISELWSFTSMHRDIHIGLLSKSWAYVQNKYCHISLCPVLSSGALKCIHTYIHT